MTAFLGKYRGKVENNVDPLQLGRVQVSAPKALGDTTLAWAMPCSPFTGPGVGLFAVPPVGASVWVEFEGGDKDFPIYVGGFWGPGEVPASPAVAETKMLKTDGVTLTFNDLSGSGGFTIEVGPPAVNTALKLSFGASGIEIVNGSSSVKLTSSGVSLNDGALEVK